MLPPRVVKIFSINVLEHLPSFFIIVSALLYGSFKIFHFEVPRTDGVVSHVGYHDHRMRIVCCAVGSTKIITHFSIDRIEQNGVARCVLELVRDRHPVEMKNTKMR